MSYRGGLMAYFDNNGKRFNKEEEHLRTIIEKNEDDCQIIDLNHLFPDGALPIHYACLYNSTKYFMNSELPHTQINIPGGSYNSTPIMFTIKNSNYKILLSLLLNGADIFQKNSRSFDVLSFCVLYDDVLGIILVLSFIEKNIPINNYLELSQKENNEQIEEFLVERKNEIEGKEVETKSWHKYFKFSKAQLIVALVCTVLGFIFQNLKWLIAAFFFFIYSPFFIWSPFPLISNVMFSIYTYYETLNSMNNLFEFLFIFCIIHSLSFFAIYFIETPFFKINKIKDANSLVTDLIFKDEYKTEKFCSKCIRKQLLVDGHCNKCKRCVAGHIFHCPLLDKCISTKTNKVFFKVYYVLTLILYGFAAIVTYKDRNLSFYVFLICLFSNLVSYFMFSWAEDKRKWKILYYIRDKYNIPIEFEMDSRGIQTVRYRKKYEEWIENEN